MLRYLADFFRSFFSIKPYQAAINGTAPLFSNLLTAMILFVVVLDLIFILISCYLQFYLFAPIINHMPKIVLEDKIAHSEDKMPVILTSNKSPLNRIFLKDENPRDAVFNFYIDTTRKADEFYMNARHPEHKLKPEYRDYTWVFAKDALILNSKVPAKTPFEDIQSEKYVLNTYSITVYWLTFLVSLLFISPIILVIWFFVLLGFGWKFVVGSVVSALAITSALRQELLIGRSISLAGFILFPSALVFWILNFFVSPVIWLFYLVWTLLMAGILFLCMPNRLYGERQDV